MDPITAVGFAASILTLIDFSYKIVTGTLEVIKTGSLSENTHISIVINDFQAAAEPLSRQPTGISEHEVALKELATDCLKVSQRLSSLLETLKTDPKGSSWKSVKVSLRSMRKKGKVVDLEEQLNKYRSEIMTRLALILNERQVSIQIQLSDFQSQVQKQSLDAMEQLQTLRNDVLEVVENTLRQIPPQAYKDSKDGSNRQGSVEGKAAQNLDINGQMRLAQTIRESLDGLLQSKTVPSPEIRVLKQLYFASLYWRKDGVQEASVHTFEWVLEYPVKHSEGQGKDDASYNRNSAASRFLHWLREGNGVFHISGKAGSGKSTMMKLILNHERTKQELDTWAGEKQLIFAHFFFWSSGVKMQSSLEGLYRSILFEILIQCPILIRDVFPRAYRAFSKTRVEESIDELFFRFSDIRKAFENLVTRSPHPGYRFCLFIDGLDEYGGDDIGELEHQLLADSLKTWAFQGDIKILASSRPHRQFEETFSDELRIRLHELTRADIVLASRQMFEKDKSFKRPEVQACYAGLAENVAESSEGVFLWASLAVRALLNSIGRYDPIDSLGQLLQVIPRNFNHLYEKLFMSIEPADQTKAFKLLLLVADVPEEIGLLNALVVTWLNDLENPEFPTKCEFKPYTDQEIEDRQLEAKFQVDSLTKGLVEITALGAIEAPFFQKRVQFFHRTLRDFVHQSQIIQEFAAKFPYYTDITTYARLVLAELYFGRTEDIAPDSSKYWNILSSHEYRFPIDGLLNAYGQAIEHHNKSNMQRVGIPAFCGFTTTLQEISIGAVYGSRSFLHFTARSGFVDYVQRKVAANPDLLQPQGEMSLLLSAISYPNSSAMVKALLEAGASPHDLVWSHGTNMEASEFTIWQLFCTASAYELMSPTSRSIYLRPICEIIQYFLEAGAESNCFILLTRKDEDVAHPTHAISLRTLVRQLDPPNRKELLNLMEGPKTSQGILGVFGAAWKYITAVNSSTTTTIPFRSEDYIPFDLAMDPYFIDKELKHTDALFSVRAVQCGGKLVDPQVTIRFC